MSLSTTPKGFHELTDEEKESAYQYFLEAERRERTASLDALGRYLSTRQEIQFVIHDVSDSYTTISVIYSYSAGYDGETDISNVSEEVASVLGYEMCDDHDGRLTPKFMVYDTSDVVMKTIAADLYIALFNKAGSFKGYSRV